MLDRTWLVMLDEITWATERRGLPSRYYAIIEGACDVIEAEETAIMELERGVGLRLSGCRPYARRCLNEN